MQNETVMSRGLTKGNGNFTQRHKAIEGQKELLFFYKAVFYVINFPFVVFVTLCEVKKRFSGEIVRKWEGFQWLV